MNGSNAEAMHKIFGEAPSPNMAGIVGKAKFIHPKEADMKKEEVIGEVLVSCYLCKIDILAKQYSNGYIKFQCPECGAVSVLRNITRRKFNIEICKPRPRVVARTLHSANTPEIRVL